MSSSTIAREGKASDLKKETEYSGIKGEPNSRVKGSSDYGLYYDSLGKLTAGIGDLITSEEEAQEKMHLTKEEALKQFNDNKKRNVAIMKADLERSGVDYDNLPQRVKDAVDEASFQMGTFKSFPSLKRALSKGDFEEAAVQAMTTNGAGSSASSWIKQTPVRVRDFVEGLTDCKYIKKMFNKLNDDNRFDFKD